LAVWQGQAVPSRLTPLVLDNFGLANALNDLIERTGRSHPDVQVTKQQALGNRVLIGTLPFVFHSDF
jgi:signal transduction histidine kinase